MRGGGRKDCKLGGRSALKQSWKVGRLSRTDGLMNIVCVPKSLYVRTLDTYARELLMQMEQKNKQKTVASTQPVAAYLHDPHHARRH